VVENIDHIKATHDGYRKRFGILHTREWKFEEDKIVIIDNLNKESNAVVRVHFHPDITKEEILKRINIQHSTFNIQHYNYASEFNRLQKALVLEISFKKELKVEIKI
jgi:hypothetical protein